MPTPTYEYINSSSPSTGTTSVSFSSIPQTYTDLILVANLTRNLSGSGGRGVRIYFNADNGNNYSYTRSYINGSDRFSSTIQQIFTEGQSRVVNIAHIMEYANTNMNKTTISFNGAALTNDNVFINAGNWQSTAAITTVTISDGGYEGFVTGDTVTLWGIKAE